MIYGRNKTIHDTQHLGVEVDKDGKVVGVWFRCLLLPFEQLMATDTRAHELRLAYQKDGIPKLNAVDVELKS